MYLLCVLYHAVKMWMGWHVSVYQRFDFYEVEVLDLNLNMKLLDCCFVNDLVVVNVAILG